MILTCANGAQALIVQRQLTGFPGAVPSACLGLAPTYIHFAALTGQQETLHANTNLVLVKLDNMQAIVNGCEL